MSKKDALAVELYGSKHDGDYLTTTFNPLDIFEYDNDLFLISKSPIRKGGKIHKAVCINKFTAEAISSKINIYTNPINGNLKNKDNDANI